jgi:hypothetical protein
VKKVILEVSNAPVATLVNRVLVPMVRAKHVRLVNLVHPMIRRLFLARHVIPAIINTFRAKRLVCRAYLARMKIELVHQNVKIAALDNIKMYLATTLA